MKVLLVTLNSKFIHSSLALAYLESYCESDSWNIEVVEYTINENISDILADIHMLSPDLLCFSCYIWNIEYTLEICNDYKKINPHIPIILGGPEVSYDAVEILNKHSVDYIIRGEGEETLKHLLETIYTDSSYSRVKGITYKENGEVYENPDRELIDDLDIIPFPYKDRLERYVNKTIYYESSRGCPFNCAYCLSSTIKGVRFFPLPRVKKDLGYLMANKVREVKFVDRTFNCNEKRSMEIMQYIIENNISTKFHFEIAVELISAEFLAFLKDMPKNMFDFEIGVQSTYPQALQAVNRAFDWDVLKNLTNRLIQFDNIHIHLDLIAGLPHETYEDFGKSFNDVYHFKADMLQLGFLKLLKGSPIRDDVAKYKYIFQTKPPYQVLANHVVTYDDMILLDHIEKLVDIYYNSHIIDDTLDFIINEIFSENAFLFFAAFAKYWREHGLFFIGHKRGKLYTIVRNYISSAKPDYSSKVNETLKYDYFVNNKSYNTPDGITSFPPVDTTLLLNNILRDKAFVAKNIEHMQNKTVRNIKKYVHLEYFDLNPLALYIEPGYVLFSYGPDKKADYVVDISENVQKYI
ncbi:MAG TPA: DUF4080 domain-containing protein [Syntrophomonadaceae bacterium]|nr:DUF4080 domain-containing protein [Syntrophomonadaceae bacterium]